MATGKKSFILYCDLIHTVEKMPDEKAGELFKHILEYVNDNDPITEDLIIQLTFEPIKQQLKRDLKDWESERMSRSNAGKLGMEKRWHNKDNTDNKAITKHNSVINPITNITDNVTVTVTDNVTDNVKVNNIEERKLKFADTLKSFNSTYDRNLLLEFYKYWTEPNQSNTKFKKELEKTWDLSRRLETWSKNDKNFSKPKSTEIPKIDTSNNIYESKSPDKWI